MTLQEFQDTPEFGTICQKVKALPGRVACLVDLSRQGFNEKSIQIPDKVQARMDRMSVPPYLLRKTLIVSSGVPMVESGDYWYVHPNEGQWWESSEVKELGFTIPDNFQMRFYGAFGLIEEQVLLKCC